MNWHSSHCCKLGPCWPCVCGKDGDTSAEYEAMVAVGFITESTARSLQRDEEAEHGIG